MKTETSKLTGLALRWAVAKAEDTEVQYGIWNTLWVCDKNVFGEPRCVQGDDGEAYAPDFAWRQGGPIIEREGIEVSPLLAGEPREPFRGWFAGRSIDSMDLFSHEAIGPTPLIAAMRCYVAFKLGDEIDVPEELL